MLNVLKSINFVSLHYDLVGDGPLILALSVHTVSQDGPETVGGVRVFGDSTLLDEGIEILKELKDYFKTRSEVFCRGLRLFVHETERFE